MLEQLLNTLISTYKLTPFKKNEKKHEYTLTFGAHTIVGIDHLPIVTLKCRICSMAEENVEDFLIYLMKANFLGQGTGGSALSLSADEKHLTLVFHLPYEVKYEEFRDIFEDFINYIEYWQIEIEKFKSRKPIL